MRLLVQVWPADAPATDALHLSGRAVRELAQEIAHAVTRHRPAWVGRRLRVWAPATGHHWTVERAGARLVRA